MQKLLSWLNQHWGDIFKIGTITILLVVPLYPKFPIFIIPKTHVAIRAEDFLLLILGVFWFAYFLKNKPSQFLKNRLNLAIILFLGAGLLSLVSGIFLTSTISPQLGIFHFLRRVEYILPFFIAASAVRLTGKAQVFAESVFIVVFIAYLYALGQIYMEFPVISTQNEEYAKGLALHWVPGARLHSTFAGHYDLAAFQVLALPLAMSFFFVYKKFAGKLFVLLAGILPSFWLILNTESRISFVSAGVAVVVMLLLIGRKKFIIPAIIIGLVSAMYFSGLGARYRYTIDLYWEKLFFWNQTSILPSPAFAQEEIPAKIQENIRSRGDTGVVVIEDRSTSIRLNVEWPRAIRAFSKNPLLGTGYSSITLATDSDYLRLLGEVGIVGAAAFLLLMTRLIRGFFAYLKSVQELTFNKAYVAAFLGGFIGMLINATFIDVFEASKVAIVFWTLAGIAVAIVQGRKDDQIA